MSAHALMNETDHSVVDSRESHVSGTWRTRLCVPWPEARLCILHASVAARVPSQVGPSDERLPNLARGCTREGDTRGVREYVSRHAEL